MISRRYKVQEKRLTRKGIFLLFISLGLLVLLIFGGIPLLIQFAAFVGNIKSSSAPIAQEDKTPPSPPNFDSLPQYVKENKIKVRGKSEAGSILTLFKNEEEVKEIVIDEDSSFSIEVILSPGKNTIWTVARDQAGNESRSSALNIIYDIEPPKLTVNKPSSGESLYGDQKTITIEGETEPDAGVMINDRLAIVDNEGKFSQKITLSEGENKLIIVATDQAENKTEQTITVTYTP